MWLFNLPRTTWTLYASSIFWQFAAGNPALSLRGCNGNPYCKDEDGQVKWHNDCGIERPSAEVFEQHKLEDIPWFRAQLDEYLNDQRNQRLEGDEKSWPSWMTKRFAPDHPPSSMICDGLGSCAAPSCKDVGRELTPDVKRRMLLFFDFLSVVDHSHHAMTEAHQDYFIELSFDVDWMVSQFSYSDELQDAAKKKRQKRELMISLISGALLVGSALTGTGALWAGAITSGTARFMSRVPLGRLAGVAARSSRGVQAAARGLKLPSGGMAKQMETLSAVTGGIITSGFIGVTGLMKEANKIKHGDDEEGFDKFLISFKHYLAGLAEDSSYELASQMMLLSMGGKLASHKDLVDLYASGFYSDTNVNLRGHIKYELRKYYTGRVIETLWETEGTYIVSSRVPKGSTCDQDRRGDPKGRVCLEERPEHVYYIRAMSLHRDKKIRLPPGIDNLMDPQGFNGITLEDVVRSSLFQVEVWRPTFKGEGEPDVQTLLEESTDQVPSVFKRHFQERDTDLLDSFSSNIEQESDRNLAKRDASDDHTVILDHYGSIPGAMNIGICYSWYGEAITEVESSDNTNGPCLCDPPAPRLARHWGSTTNWTDAYTERFILDAKLYENDKYGKMCRKHNKCKKDGSWQQRLDLPKGAEVAKEMKSAWKVCNHPRGHGDHDPGPKASKTEAESPAANTNSGPKLPTAKSERPAVNTKLGAKAPTAKRPSPSTDAKPPTPGPKVTPKPKSIPVVWSDTPFPSITEWVPNPARPYTTEKLWVVNGQVHTKVKTITPSP